MTFFSSPKILWKNGDFLRDQSINQLRLFVLKSK